MNRPAYSWILRSSFVLAVGVILSVLQLQAQVDTGSITGTVTDPSGAVVSGAKVTLTNEGTAASLTTTTGSDGLYRFSPVRIGNYKLEVSVQGFKTATELHVVVNVSSNVTRNFQLQTGAVSETVEVTSTAPLLQSQDASVGQVVDQKNVNDLPLNGRNFTFLAQLAAGVNSPQADTRGNAASGAFAANGSRPAQNNYMLDGIDNNSDTVDFLNGTNFVVLPPVDAIQEFKVQTTNFSAEFGRSGAAVLNATIKSGTNEFHGSAWEFFRNDKLDAADYFERGKKGELRQNQYGVTFGGPVIKNKIFFFGDYEGFNRRQGIPHAGTVPTVAERNSGYSNFQDMITGQSGSQTDTLGRTIPQGAVLDPATTRATTASVADPVTGIVAASTGFVRDPFSWNTGTSANTFGTGTCPFNTTNFTSLVSACNLNNIDPTRLDANAIALLNLYPSPISTAFLNNYNVSPVDKEDRKAFDTRLDINFASKDQLFFRFSYVDDPNFIPAIFGGIPDGGAFQEGPQTALAQQSALVWTHSFSPTMVNVARAGLNYLHTTRVSPAANDLSGIPGKYGIQGIPQQHENGGLPAFGINGLSTLGGNAFLPSDEVSSTIQLNDDFTKIYGKHTFKMGIEWQHVKFSTLQPPWSRGEFDYGGTYTDVAGSGHGGNTGRADFLLSPIAAQDGGTVNYSGGPNSIFVSNISLTDNGKNYYGTYFQDDWRVSPKLTVNLGLRWDFFGLVYEHHANQANFAPSGPPTGSPLYIIPDGPNAAFLKQPVDCVANPNFLNCLLAKDGIGLAITNKYGKGLGDSQKANFAPRIGFAYQVTPKLVARGGFGLFYNGFENRGFSPNLGENYPFQFNFSFFSPNDISPYTYTGCSNPYVGPNGEVTLETGFSCTPLDPTLVNASGLGLRGIQFKYITPYSMGGNLTLQYQLTPSLSVQGGYVTSLGRHLEVFPGSNQVTQVLPNLDVNGKGLDRQKFVQFPDFGYNNSYATTNGSSYYHGLQFTAEKRFSGGLAFLGTYTYSKVRSDAYDLLNGFSSAGSYRAPLVPGFGINHDYGLANFDVRNVVHLSGAYELPFGKGKRYMGNASGVANAIAGGWSLQWIATLQGGQPQQFACPTGTSTGSNCTAFVLPGINPHVSRHVDPKNGAVVLLNPAAFAQPCQLEASGIDPTAGYVPTNTPTGCVPLTTAFGALGGAQPSQFAGPGYHKLDFSLFKQFKVTERVRMEFRSEFFNILNHPNFNAPGFGGNGVNSVSGSTNFLPGQDGTFGETASSRDGAYSSREIQFALKLYF
jgi:hypothetical protein